MRGFIKAGLVAAAAFTGVAGCTSSNTPEFIQNMPIFPEHERNEILDATEREVGRELTGEEREFFDCMLRNVKVRDELLIKETGLREMLEPIVSEYEGKADTMAADDIAKLAETFENTEEFWTAIDKLDAILATMGARLDKTCGSGPASPAP